MSPTDCPFCRIIRGDAPAVIVHEDRDTLAIMDLYPATQGHVLVIPRQHVDSIYVMPAKLGARIMVVAIALAKSVKRQLAPAGLNLIQANETAGGQTIPHFHLHIVPRYSDDQIILRFGHGSTPADIAELARLASLIRSGLTVK